jgi:nicotinamidase/pyrazinamidase
MEDRNNASLRQLTAPASRIREEVKLQREALEVTMKKKALLIIDMLNDFVREGAPLEVPLAREIIPNLQKRLAAAREEGWEIVYICDAHAPDDPEFANWPPHAVRETEGAQVVAEIAPRDGERVVPKTTLLGFYATDLEDHLKALGVEELILTGCVTNICIYFIALEAAVRGYRVRVPADSVAPLDVREGDFALGQMEKILGVRVER